MPNKVTSLLGSPIVSESVRRLNGRPLRVLAYHDVVDAARFQGHLEYLLERYRPVTGSDVATAVRSGAALPEYAVWVTFDDAHPGVIDNGLRLLQRFGVPATLFVCPGLIDTDTPYWWQVFDAALSLQVPIDFEGQLWRDRQVVTRLKREPDVVRRQAVARIADRVESTTGERIRRRQITSEELQAWLGEGRDVGNHTWDHPCLDTCTPDEQRFQIERAHDALSSLTTPPPLLFAYPNGNTTEASQRTLKRLGYGVEALFDHKLCRNPNRQVSRLRLDADAAPERMRAILSGGHSGVYGAGHHLLGLRRS